MKFVRMYKNNCKKCSNIFFNVIILTEQLVFTHYKETMLHRSQILNILKIFLVGDSLTTKDSQTDDKNAERRSHMT